MNSFIRMTLNLTVSGLLLLASSVWAGDGVLEINQTCAQSGGCFAGDGPGFPVTITQPGSYMLTGNLSPGALGAIAASVKNVSIDLNGFSITGAASGSGIGVSGVSGLTVRNGTIQKMGGDGISGVSYLRVEGMLLFQNGGRGISAGIQCFVKDTMVRENSSDGIHLSTSSLVESSSSVLNGGHGIWLNTGIVRNSSVVNNDGNGVQIAGAGLVIGNEIRLAGMSALAMDSDVGYAENQIFGTVSGGIEVGINICNGNTTCP